MMDGKNAAAVCHRALYYSDEITQRNQQQSVLYLIYKYTKRSELKWIKDIL